MTALVSLQQLRSAAARFSSLTHLRVMNATPHTLQHPEVGVFAFQSAKQARLDSAHQGRCLAHIFVLNVGEELESWPEHPARERRWVSDWL